MRYTGKQITSRIKSYIQRQNGGPAGWFIGVSAEPRSMLFEKHAVQKKGGYWILIHATSSAVAQKVKSFLATKLGMTTGAESLDKADFVYAYKKTPNTSP